MRYTLEEAIKLIAEEIERYNEYQKKKHRQVYKRDGDLITISTEEYNETTMKWEKI